MMPIPVKVRRQLTNYQLYSTKVRINLTLHRCPLASEIYLENAVLYYPIRLSCFKIKRILTRIPKLKSFIVF